MTPERMVEIAVAKLVSELDYPPQRWWWTHIEDAARTLTRACEQQRKHEATVRTNPQASLDGETR